MAVLWKPNIFWGGTRSEKFVKHLFKVYICICFEGAFFALVFNRTDRQVGREIGDDMQQRMTGRSKTQGCCSSDSLSYRGHTLYYLSHQGAPFSLLLNIFVQTGQCSWKVLKFELIHCFLLTPWVRTASFSGLDYRKCPRNINYEEITGLSQAPVILVQSTKTLVPAHLPILSFLRTFLSLQLCPCIPTSPHFFMHTLNHTSTDTHTHTVAVFKLTQARSGNPVTP